MHHATETVIFQSCNQCDGAYRIRASAEKELFPMPSLYGEGVFFFKLVPLNNIVNSKLVVVIKPGASIEVFGYEIDELILITLSW